MATAPKHPPHRLGFVGDPDPDGPREFGRWIYLQRLAELHPDVLSELRALPIDDEAALQVWAARWWLVDAWCLSFARATQHLWHLYPTAPTCWADRDDVDGMLVPQPAPVIKRPPKMPHHVDWLIRYQLGEDWSAMAPRNPVRAIEGGGVRTDEPTPRGAGVILARFLDLTPRPTRRGRRRKR